MNRVPLILKIDRLNFFVCGPIVLNKKILDSPVQKCALRNAPPWLSRIYFEAIIFMKIFVILFSCFVFPAIQASSQMRNADSAIVMSQSKKVYFTYIGDQAQIYNGRQYIPYYFQMIGSPYFLSDSLSEGWISYDRIIYENVPMQLDVSRDQLVIANPAGGQRIFLQNERIDSFYFLNHTFIRLAKNPAKNIETDGFYDLLYRGSLQVYVLRNKKFTESFQDGKIVRVFNNHDRFFILKNGQFFPVKNEDDVFGVLGSKRQEIKKILRGHNLKFRRDGFESALTMAVTLFDQLKN